MHHGLSLLTWPAGLCHPACHWFLLCCVSMEFSTPAVQLRWFIAQHWGKDTRLYLANGLAMVLGFKLCRIVPMFHNMWGELLRVFGFGAGGWCGGHAGRAVAHVPSLRAN